MKCLSVCVLITLTLLTIQPLNAATGPFRDLERGHWAEEEVLQLYKDGIIQGYNGNFMGKKSFTRYEMAVILAPLVKQFNEIYNLVKKHQKAGTLGKLVDETELANYAEENNTQFAMVLDSIDKLQSSIRKQNNRLDRLEAGGSGQPVSNSSILSLREDLTALENSVENLKDTVKNRPAEVIRETVIQSAGSSNGAGGSSSSGGVDSVEFAQLRDMVESNSSLLDDIMNQKMMAESVKPQTEVKVTGSTEEVERLLNLYNELKGQLAANTQRLTNITVEGSVNSVKIEELTKLKGICQNLGERIENNSQVLTNLVVKSSVNEVNIEQLQSQK